MSLATRVNENTELARQAPGRPTIAQLIDRQRPEIARALPSHMNPDRLARIATTVIRQTPKLMECSAESLLGALMTSAQTGLEPGPLGHAYFVPKRIKGQMECVWMLGYKGIVELARRSGRIKSIEAREVCERDEFDYAYGLEDRLHHKPFMGGERGPLVAVYGVARFSDGGHFFVVLSKADIDQRAQRSETWGKDFSPWKSDYAAMARKTAIRAMAPFLPLSPEQASIIARDEQVRSRVDDDLVDDAPAFIDAEVGELEPGDSPIGAERGQELHKEAGRFGLKDNNLHVATALVVSNGRTSHYSELTDLEAQGLPDHWNDAKQAPADYVRRVLSHIAEDSEEHPVLSAWLGKQP